MTQQVKSIIQTIASVTIGLIMLGSIFAYFYTGYHGYPLYILLRFILLAIIVNSIGFAIIANYASLSNAAKPIKIIFYFLSGLYLSIYLFIGFLKNTFATAAEAYFALFLSILISLLLIVYFQSREEDIKRLAAGFLIFVFFSIAVIGFFIQPENPSPIQTHQTIFAIFSLMALLAIFETPRKLLEKYFKKSFAALPHHFVWCGGKPIDIAALVLFLFLAGFSLYVIFIFKSLGGFLNYAIKSQQALITPQMAIYQLIYFIVLSLVGVGFLMRRTLSETLKRLGLVLLSKNGISKIIGFTVLLIFVNFLFEQIGATLGLVDLAADKEANRLILQNFRSIGNMLILALAAGIGEEILFRGALQPKFGIFFTTLLFTLVHGQYQWWGLLNVFALGLVLAYQRKISNTTSTVISHAFYDIIGLVLIFLIK